MAVAPGSVVTVGQATWIRDEKSGAVRVTFSVPTALGNDVVLQLGTIDGSAVAGQDYTPWQGMLTIPAGMTEASLDLAIVDDALPEGSEWFGLNVLGVVGAAISDVLADGLTVIVAPSDPPPPGLAGTFVHIGELVGNASGGVIEGFVRLDHAQPGPFDINYVIRPYTAGAGDVNQPLTGTVTVPAGFTWVPVFFHLTSEAAIEKTESLTVAFDTTQPGVTIVDPVTMATIEDDDVSAEEFAERPRVSLRDYVAGDDGLVTVRVQLDHPTDHDVFVKVHLRLDGTTEFPIEQVLAKNGDVVIPEGDRYAELTLRLGTTELLAGLREYLIDTFLTDPEGADLGRRNGVVRVVRHDATSGSASTEAAARLEPNSLLLMGPLATLPPPAPLPMVSAEHAVTNEVDGYFDVVLRLNQPSDSVVSVTYAPQFTTNINTIDYSDGQRGTVSFAPGEVMRTVRFAMEVDFGAESAESFFLQLSAPVNAVIGVPQALLTIAANGATGVPVVGTPSARVLPVTLDEQAGVAAFVVLLDRPSTGDVQIDFSTIDGTAVAGSDFVGRSGSIGFAPGQTAQTIYIPIFDDTSLEPEESFGLVLSNAIGATIAVSQATARIGASDAAPVALPLLDVQPQEFNEGVGWVDVVFRLNAPSAQVTQVTYNDIASTLNFFEVSYHASSSKQTLSFAPGETMKIVRYAVWGGDGAERAESFSIVLSDPQGLALANTYVVMTLARNEGATAANPWISVENTAVDEAQGVATFVVRLSQPSAGVVTVRVDTADGSAVAVDGQSGIGDYLAYGGTVAFAPGETTKTVTVQLANDLLPEGDELFALQLSQPVGGTLATSRAVALIGANDGASVALPVVSAQPVAGDEVDGWVDFIVRLSAPATQRVSVTLFAGQGSDGFGDDGTVSNTITFEIGETLKLVRLPLVDDLLAEGVETTYAGLNTPVNAVVGVPTTARSIGTSDGSGGGMPNLNVANVTVDEKSGSATFVLWLDRSTDVAVSVSYSTDIADTPATRGLDYTVVSGSVTFLPGQTVKSITVPITDDALAEGDEALLLLFSSPQGLGLARHGATATIVANDATAVPLPVVSIDAAVCDEEAGYVDVAVRLSAPSAQQVSVRVFDTTIGGGAGSADFVSRGNNTVVFAPGETLKVVRWAVTDDALVESNEQFRVNLSNPAGVTLGTSTALVTINDRDGGPSVAITDNVAGVASGNVEFTFTFSEAVTGLTTSGISLSSGSLLSVAGAGNVWTATASPVAGAVGDMILTLHADAVLGVGGYRNKAASTSQAYDTQAPVLSGVVPADGASGVATTSHIVLSFNEAVVKGSGVLELRRGDGSLVESFDVATSARLQLSGDGRNLSIDPTASLAFNASFVLAALPAGLVLDLAGNQLAATAAIGFTTAANAAPVAANASVNATEDQALSGQLPAASDAEGHAITYSAGGAVPAKGQVQIAANGAYTYTPTANANGSDSFGFVVTDAFGASNSYTASVSIAAVNDVPIASDRTDTVDEDSVFTGQLAASDVDGDTLTFSRAGNAAHGEAVVNANGSFSYTPNADANGSDSFSFTVSDGQGGSITRQVSLTINAVNDAPRGAGASLSATEDQPLSGQLPAATDPEGQAITYSAGGATPTKGQVQIAASGAFTYTPAANANGSDSFGFVVADAAGASNSYTMSVSIVAVNDAPTASDSNASLDEDSVLDGQLAASDIDGDSLSFSRASNAAKGLVVVNANGSYRYTPNANANGSDAFTFTVSDGQGGSLTRQVSLSIRAVNDAPVGGITLTGTPTVFETLGHFSTLTDADGLGGFSFQWLRGGTLVAGATQSSYTLQPADAGAAMSLRVSYVDGGGSSESVTSVASAPVLAANAINGGNGNDTLAGTSGNDLVSGGTGNDTLLGAEGRDSLAGGDGDDVLEGGPGDDILQGNDGVDVASYPGNTAVVVNFTAGTATRGSETDRLLSIEAIFGSAGADTLRGASQADNLRGETLRGGGGDDSIDGAGGVDTAEFSGPRAGYRVTRDLGSGVITVTDIDPSNGDSGTDTLVSIERLVFADQTLAFGARADDIVRVAFALWGPAIVGSTALFSRGYSFYDVGYSFEQMSGAALQFWAQLSDSQLAAQLITNSGTAKTSAQLLATLGAAGGGDAGRAAMVREAANDPAMLALVNASPVQISGVVASNLVPDFGQLFGLLPG